MDDVAGRSCRSQKLLSGPHLTRPCRQFAPEAHRRVDRHRVLQNRPTSPRRIGRLILRKLRQMTSKSSISRPSTRPSSRQRVAVFFCTQTGPTPDSMSGPKEHVSATTQVTVVMLADVPCRHRPRIARSRPSKKKTTVCAYAERRRGPIALSVLT